MFLLTVYAKGRLGNLTDKQVNILKDRTKKLLESYRGKKRTMTHGPQGARRNENAR